MTPEYSPAVVRALEAAQRWAGRSGSTAVQPVHLLLGLVEEEEGRVATLLTRTGLDPVSVRKSLGAATGADAAIQPHAPLALSLQTQEVLSHARSIIGTFSVEGTLTSEQVLLSLLERETAVRRELEALGLSWSRLEAEALGPKPALRPEEPLLLEEPIQFEGPTPRMDAARILDASANRAREALRVVEDYCRFVLDDAYLSGETKRLRHDLAEILVQLDPDGSLSLAARETLRDVGTRLTTSREQQRQSLDEVVRANLKRLQEALRSLEEYGKLHGPAAGAAFEQLRYRTYTLERAILLGRTARQRLPDARLYLLVSGSACVTALDWTIAEAAAGGVQIVQLREKDMPDRPLLERAREVRHWTRQAGVLFIMNDRPDIACLVEADGVHLGQDELPVKEARRILGPDALIGVSTHDIAQVRQAINDGASYLGVGPTFPSGTKEFGAFPGLAFVRAATAETSLPAFAIGGVNRDNVGEAVAAGARRVAVCQAVCRADDPRRAAAELRRALEASSHREHREHRE